MNGPLAWLSLIIPGAIFAWGVTVFVVRLTKIRSSFKPDPESVVLGAVSHSLRERGELAANLGELRTIHEKLLDALPVGLLWVDQRGNIGALNHAGRALLDVKLDIVGLDAKIALTAFPWLLDILTTNSRESYRIADSSNRRWEVMKILTPDKVGALVQFDNVTEMENDERRRAIQDRFAELGEMTAGLAHQLKNGLAVIQGQGQLLLHQGHSEAAMEITQEAASLERLAVRFLQWAKPLTPKLSPTNLSSVIDEAIIEIRRRPCSSNVIIEMQGGGQALADPTLLREALINIIENACQACSVGGRVTVSVSDSAIEINDEGVGVTQEDLTRLLRPFESGRPDGTGLGLPLAFKWLNAQGADLRVNKRTTGGSSFVVKW